MQSSIIQFINKGISQTQAYRKFLRKNKIRISRIKNAKDFARLPIMDKNNFIYKYPLMQLFYNSRVPAMTYASSGSSGNPTFWFRDDKQESVGGEIHLQIFRDIFNIKKSETTLVIVCFSTGIWIAGNFTLAACRHVSRQGFNLTTVTPGIEKEDIFNCLKFLAPKFKNVILAGYPPFIMDILNESIDRQIQLPKNLKILTAGDKFTEEWRDAVIKLLRIKNKYSSIISIYGCADAAVLGFETPLSIFLRRESLKFPELYERLFGSEEDLPALVQYDPELVFFEEINNELIITAQTGIPLIRYNIHDIGRIIYFEEIIALMKEFKLINRKSINEIKRWRLPFIVKKGRTDVAVTFYAINIYPEHLKTGIAESNVYKYITGNFLAYNKDLNKHKNQKLYIKVQLKTSVIPSKKIKQLLTKGIANNLIRNSIEYRKLYAAIGKKALPEIVLVKDFTSDPSEKSLLSIQGRKPRVLLRT